MVVVVIILLIPLIKKLKIIIYVKLNIQLVKENIHVIILKMYIIYKKSGTKAPFIWFLSLIGTGTLLIVIVINDVNKQNWFTGKYWKKNK